MIKDITLESSFDVEPLIISFANSHIMTFNLDNSGLKRQEKQEVAKQAYNKLFSAIGFAPENKTFSDFFNTLDKAGNMKQHGSVIYSLSQHINIVDRPNLLENQSPE